MLARAGRLSRPGLRFELARAYHFSEKPRWVSSIFCKAKAAGQVRRLDPIELVCPFRYLGPNKPAALVHPRRVSAREYAPAQPWEIPSGNGLFTFLSQEVQGEPLRCHGVSNCDDFTVRFEKLEIKGST